VGVGVKRIGTDVTLLDFIRDYLGLKGTKYGCGRGLCGACTVHVNGTALRSCLTSVANVVGERVTTIEGLASDTLHPVQESWIAESVPQCGYCQPGQIMTAAAFLRENPKPSDEEIREAMDGNLCRCGTYDRIRRAVRRAARMG
jgi:aerobic-type carbon monoxide dehydrogenase small subunit (CoxS/CutS family)